MTAEEQHNSEKIVYYFLSNLDNLRSLSEAEGRDVLHLASYTAFHCQNSILKNKCLDLLYHCCFYLKDIDLKELWNIYWILNRALFTDYNVRLTGNIDELYKHIFVIVLKKITDQYERLEAGSNLILMVTSQFLGINHAPTRRILDYSYTIATSLHKRVMIINDAGLNYYPCACLEQNFTPAYFPELNNTKIISYKEINIPFMQIPGYMPDIYSLKENLREIYQLQPELVYNIGGSSIFADLCSLFTKTACFPCSTNIPQSMSKYLLVGRNLNESDKLRLERMESYQEIIETVVNYELQESPKQYTRTEFGIPSDSFVIGVIGNRLDSEISDEFICLMDMAINQFDVHFLIIGSIIEENRIKNNVMRSQNLHFTGYLSETSEAMKLLDIYWNSKRSGGGRSSFEALANGIPVTTLKFGDVYYTCGNEFGVEKDSDFLQQLDLYINEKEYLKTMKKKSLERAACLSDLPGTQKKILEQILGKI
ncbi:MAG: glycosyltransferase family 4 protein [Lachnospiraceae bacterium]|nr:glycosyltransferase family 4 protein [Lachnospiraceae bacterium]